MRNRLRLIVVLFAAGWAAGLPAPPGRLRAQGSVLAFADGDSFALRRSDRRRVSIRLHAIDAPELLQARGEASRRALIDLVAGRPQRIDRYTRDPRGRFICLA